MDDKNRKWFAVRTKPQQEAIASMHYERQGFEVYLPMMEKTWRHARRIEKVKRAFFPGYIFLHLSPAEQDWTRISSTIGAIGPISFGGYYPPVPDWIIAGIRTRENGQGVISLRTISDAVFKPGTKVKVALGNKDIEGIFVTFKDDDRVVVLLDILQRQLPVKTRLAGLKKVA